jgi:hypothetical protein
MDRLSRWSLLMVLLTVVSAAGCLDPTRQRLLGTWDVQLEMNAAEFSEMTAIENPWVAALGNTLMRTVQASMRLEFRADDTCTWSVSLMGNSFSRLGRWRVGQTRGDTATILTYLEGEPEPRHWEIQFLDENTFQTIPPQDAQLRISRMVTFRREGG